MQFRAPDEGPSNIGSPPDLAVDRRTVTESTSVEASRIDRRRPPTEATSTEERHGSRLLRAVVKKYNIDSMKTLVAAYNSTTTDETERTVLLGWLREYIEKSAECLEPKFVLEYSELSKVTFRSTNDDGILGDVFRTFCSRICEKKALEPNFAISLCSALVHIDPAAYGGAPELVELAMELLASISPRPKLARKNFARHEATFLALHQTFFLLMNSNQNEINEKEKQELRQTIALKEKEMELSCEYYPVDFHFTALRQAAEHLKTKDTTSRVAQMKQYLICGLCGFVYVFHFLRILAKCDIDPEAIHDAYRRGRVAIDNMGVAKRPWFDSFRSLMGKRLELSKDETKLGLFLSEFDAAIESQQKMIKGKDLKALRFSVIQEMRLSARQTASRTVRKEVTAKLLMLATNRAIFEEWFDDADIFTAFLDALHEIHRISDDNQETTGAFLQMQQSCEGRAGSTLTAWLDGDTMENKLQMRHQQGAYAEHNKVFVKIARDVGYVPLNTIWSNVKDLKDRYKHDIFARVSITFITYQLN